MASENEKAEVYLLSNRSEQESKKVCLICHRPISTALSNIQPRLNVQHDLIMKVGDGNLIDPAIPTFPGMKIADVGTGTG